MAVDTQVGTLIINRMTKAQYDAITPSDTELYLVPDDTDAQLTSLSSSVASLQNTITSNSSSWLADNDRYVNTAAFASTGSNGAIGVKMTLTRAGSDTGTVVSTIPTASTAAAGVMTGAQVTNLNSAVASASLAKTAIQPSQTASWATAVSTITANSASWAKNDATTYAGHYTPSASGATAKGSTAARTYLKTVNVDGKGHVVGFTTGSETVTNTDRYVNTASFASTGSSGSIGVKMTLTRAGSDTTAVAATIPVATGTTAGVMTGAMVAKLNGIAAGATANTGTVTSVTVTTASTYVTVDSAAAITTTGTRKIDLSAATKGKIESGSAAHTWVTSNSGNLASSTAITTAINNLVTASGSAWTSDKDRYVNTASFASTGSNGANGVKMTLTRAGSDTTAVAATIPVVSATAAGVVTGTQFKKWETGSNWVGANSASFTGVVASASLAKTAIQPSQTASWATAATWVTANSASSHTHSNKTVLDGLTADQVNSWITASHQADAANNGLTTKFQLNSLNGTTLNAYVGGFYVTTVAGNSTIQIMDDQNNMGAAAAVWGDGVSNKLNIWGGLIQFDNSSATVAFDSSEGNSIVWSENSADIDDTGAVYEWNIIQVQPGCDLLGIITKYDTPSVV